MVPEVSVILSSFNGARYLPEQLDSLVAQSYPNLAIHIRDDGSSDETGPVLERYAAKYLNIRVSFGQRLGIAGSFFQLLKHSGETSAYFAFCDQDDVWYPDKIERAVARLSALDPGTPALYCSRLEYVNEELAHLKYSRIPERGLSFRNALVQNSATGCTVVLNRAAREMIVRALPGNCIMHDWWCYLVVSAFGSVIYDESPGISYRLHAANDTGAALSWSGDFLRRVRRFLINRRDAFRIYDQAQEFASMFGARLGGEKARLLSRFLGSKASLRERIAYAFQPGVYRQARLDNAILRLLIVFDWY